VSNSDLRPIYLFLVPHDNAEDFARDVAFEASSFEFPAAMRFAT